MRLGRALALSLIVVASCRASRPPAASGGAATAAPRVRSNVLRADYAGSAACASCHETIYEAWTRSPMHNMTRVPPTAQIRAPFDGRTFSFMNDTARLEMHGGTRTMTLTSSPFGDHTYEVTRVIGGHHREDFAGVEISPSTRAPIGPEVELILPVSYVYDSASLRLKGYSVMVAERTGLRAGGVWTETCVFCHNTVPYFDDTWGALYGRNAPGYQGEVVDRLLPPDRRFHFEVTDATRLASAVDDEARFVSGDVESPDDAHAALAHGIRTLRTGFGARHFVEMGIGCEACHGGSREHVADARVLPDFAPRAAFLEARAPASWGDVTRAQWINRTCARCHQVLFSRYPWTWEGGARRSADAGGSSITSGEARDFLMGGCAREMSCAACHDPHGEDRPETLAALATPAGNAVCTHCHEKLEAPSALRAHAHHDPAGAGGSCVACHMPRKNLGLGYALTRYHRIGSPTDPVRVERDRPLECALCHVDKSVGALVDQMETWWSKRYDREALRALYGDLGARPLEATLARGKPHEQGTAVAVLGEHHVKADEAAVARQLVNPIPLVRHWAAQALDQLHGTPCGIDLGRPTADIRAAANRCVPGAFAIVDAPTAPPMHAPAGPDED
ncbi:MAG TPA: cytochrome c3 family protein [Polyangia bacterium]|nr:cytochrome c3 family protein [Polyangia bacterium]